jgi:hypothetical protein
MVGKGRERGHRDDAALAREEWLKSRGYNKEYIF